MFKINQKEFYFLPLALFVFLMSLHSYNFFLNDYKKIFDRLNLKFNLINNQYKELQKHHPYYSIYKIAQESQNQENKIYYLYSKKNFDNPLELHDLHVRLNYFFYPIEIDPIYKLKDLQKIQFNKNDLIISDIDLKIWENNYNFSWLNPEDKEIKEADYFFQRVSPFFIYKIL